MSNQPQVLNGQTFPCTETLQRIYRRDVLLATLHNLCDICKCYSVEDEEPPHNYCQVLHSVVHTNTVTRRITVRKYIAERFVCKTCLGHRFVEEVIQESVQ